MPSQWGGSLRGSHLLGSTRRPAHYKIQVVLVNSKVTERQIEGSRERYSRLTVSEAQEDLKMTCFPQSRVLFASRWFQMIDNAWCLVCFFVCLLAISKGIRAHSSAHVEASKLLSLPLGRPPPSPCSSLPRPPRLTLTRTHRCEATFGRAELPRDGLASAPSLSPSL